MKRLYNRFNIKNVDLFATGGGGSHTISASDMQAVLSSCNVEPITFCHFIAFYQLSGEEQARAELFKYLHDFVYDELIVNNKSLTAKTLKKHHGSIVQSHINITNCVLSYLTRNKADGDLIRHHFPQVKRKTYERHYSKLMRKLISKQEENLMNYERAIRGKIKEYD